MPIAVVPLVVDILLFIPGVVPGVIALALDFGSGAIYLNHRGERKASGDDTGDDIKPHKPQRVHVRVVDEGGNVLDERALLVSAPTEVGESLIAQLDDMATDAGDGNPVHVEIATQGGPAIRLDAAAL